MVRIETLRTLNAAGEQLLRQRAEQRGRDADESVQQLRGALDLGRVRAVCLYDDAETPRGFAAWRWRNPTQNHAQVLITYLTPDAAPALGRSLVDYVFAALTKTPALNVIEVRMRDESPGVREAWLRRDLALFERCRMIRALHTTPLPVLPTPRLYQIAPWDPAFQPAAEQVAVRAHAGNVEAAAAPHLADADRLIERLRLLWADRLPGVDAWNPAASLAALHKGALVGHVVVARAGQDAHIIDLSVDPAHQQRGVARALLVRSLTLCLKQGLAAGVLTATTRNPAWNMCSQLGFQATDCGEVAVWRRDGLQLRWRTSR